MFDVLAQEGIITLEGIGVAVLTGLVAWSRVDKMRENRNGKNGGGTDVLKMKDHVRELHQWHFGAAPMGIKRPSEVMDEGLKRVGGLLETQTVVLREHTDVMRGVLRELKNGRGSVET